MDYHLPCVSVIVGFRILKLVLNIHKLKPFLLPGKRKDAKDVSSSRALPITRTLRQLRKNRLNIDGAISICDYVDRVW